MSIATGQLGDPAQAYALAHIARADQAGERVQRAKQDLDELPKLTTPTDYVNARALCVVLRPDALLTTANQDAFVAAVATARALYEAL
jgi:hypothetical protein